jgi:hypothetical protein
MEMDRDSPDVALVVLTTNSAAMAKIDNAMLRINVRDRFFCNTHLVYVHFLEFTKTPQHETC